MMRVLIAALCVASAVAFTPKFPPDWSSETAQSIVINQGGVQNSDGSICCPPTSPQCKVQTAYIAGMQYWDTTNQRMAFKNPDGSGTVSLYADGKQYAVDASGACQGYCPLEDAKLTPFSLPNGTTFHGETTYKGQKVYEWTWNQTVPIFGTVESSTFYATNTSATSYVPVAEVDLITPFGEQLGSQSQVWSKFKAGAPPADVFTVTGKDSDTCKQASGCNGQDDDPQDDDPAFVGARRLQSAQSFHTSFTSSMEYKAFSAYSGRE